MPLYDHPPHRLRWLRPSVSRDAGGGTLTAYTLIAEGVPASIALHAAEETSGFGSDPIRVTATVAFLASVFGGGFPQPGDILEDDSGQRFRIIGIRRGRAYGTIPALLYCECENLL